ncbi:hypothetical protein D1007_17770 [Hordeum vulgare]|nr:hypothetical protein D1007_17770 [Hordeum vulgare]
MGRTCVYVHHVDNDAFLKGNIDPDPNEFDMVFNFCLNYVELLEQVRNDFNWMDPSDVVEFDGRHNVGFGMHICWKTMRVNSEQCWLAYKDTVAESLDKALELFVIKINVPNLHLDLNRVASLICEASPPRINEEANIEPLSSQQSSIQHETLLEENDDIVLHDNSLGDLDKYNLQETMDHSIPYSRGYASESEDEGPDEEVDEEGFTTKEVEAFTKGVLELSVQDHGKEGQDGTLFSGVSTQQGNNRVGEEKDAVGEDQGLWERAAKKLREEDATKARNKKEEEYEARMKEELKITIDHWRYEKRMKEQHKKMMEKRQREFAASFNKTLAESTTKREREHQRFTERVMEEASKISKREEEEEEERKKKKGKGPCSTQ